MSNPIIQVRNLSKIYRLGVIGRQTLQDELHYLWLKLRGHDPFAHMSRVDSHHQHADHRGMFQALHNVTFDIQPGEIVGIIGRNGAGKSTLLKILSRITEPTSGEAIIEGRWGSLLEVGTGFHPDLTGRENVYMNGTILGMRKTEIDRKFDAIAAFSEIEQFLDTPVKRYSSGMYVRLAFAVAAHLEPDILILDEVLAVGDASFQQKCLAKIGEVAKSGRTVLFVSHNMTAIANLCQRVIFLQHGQITMDSEPSAAIARYVDERGGSGVYERRPDEPHGRLSIDKAILVDEKGSVTTTYRNSQKLGLQIQCTVYDDLQGAQVAWELWTAAGECVFCTTQMDCDKVVSDFRPGRYLLECPVDLHWLRAGRYFIRISSSIPGVDVLDLAQHDLRFDVLDDSSPVLKIGHNRRGLILPRIEWDVRRVE